MKPAPVEMHGNGSSGQAPRHPAPEPGNGASGGPVDADPRGAQPRSLVWTALVFYGVLAAVAVAWRVWLAGEPLWYASARAAALGVAPARDVAVGLLAAAVVVLFSWQFTRRTRAGEALARTLASVLGRPTLPQCLALALMSGVSEEFFFRGALQPRVGLVVASLLFGFAHFLPRRELLPWTGFSIAAGFLLGGMFAFTGNLLAPIVAHTAINAINLVLLVRNYAPEPAPDSRA